PGDPHAVGHAHGMSGPAGHPSPLPAAWRSELPAVSHVLFRADQISKTMLLAIRRHLLPLLAVALLVVVGGCARPPSIGITPLRPANLKDLQGYLLNHKADVEVFRLRGPFPVVVQEDHEIRVSAKERIEMDVYSPTLPEKAPLVIIVHGHDATKDDHGYQAMHLASCGLHAVTVQLPNTGPWVANGRMLAGIVGAIQRSPEIVDSRVDASRIILAGHSFGAV